MSRRRDLWAWAAVPVVLACAAGVGALLAVRANSHDRSARPAPRPADAAPQSRRPAPRTTSPAVSFTATASVIVPRVLGEKITQARKAVRDAGLVSEERPVASELRKKTVVAQVPAPGATAQRGDRVVLAVSLGSEQHGREENGPGDRADHGRGRRHGRNQ